MRAVKTASSGRKSAAARRRVKRMGNWRFWLTPRLGKLRPWLTWCMLVLTLTSLPLWAWWAGYPQRVYQAFINTGLSITHRMGFLVKEIYVEGRHAADSQLLLETIGLQRGDPIFKSSPQEIRHRLESMPWIRKATVERHFPGTLFVHIQERTPIAVWQHQQKFYLVDDQNIVIAPLSGDVPANLPMIVGKDAPLYASQMLKILARFPEVRQRLSSLVYVSQRRWNIILDQSLEVRLPQKGIETALARLVVLIKQKKLEPQEVFMVDLRLPDTTVIRLSPSASTRLKIKGKET